MTFQGDFPLCDDFKVQAGKEFILQLHHVEYVASLINEFGKRGQKMTHGHLITSSRMNPCHFLQQPIGQNSFPRLAQQQGALSWIRRALVLSTSFGKQNLSHRNVVKNYIRETKQSFFLNSEKLHPFYKTLIFIPHREYRSVKSQNIFILEKCF